MSGARRGGAAARALAITLVLAAGAAGPAWAQTDGVPLVIGQRLTLESKTLGEERPLSIYLPPSYGRSPDARYPVLYLLDAETHFHHLTGLAGYLSAQGLAPEMIVVGVVNTDRTRDFTPSAAADAPRSGGAARFLAFFRDELVPWVEARYRTAPYRLLFGHSATGNFGLWTMTEAPGLLDAIVAASPWVIWDDAYTVRHSTAAWRDARPPAGFLYYTAGDEPELLPDLGRYTALLRRRAGDALDWHYREMPDDDHGSLVPGTLEQGLRTLYAGWRLPPEATDLVAVRRHYRGLSERFGYPVQPPEQAVNVLGYRQLAAGRRTQALELLRANVEAYPGSANVYDSLGEALEATGDVAGAVAQYERAVALGESRQDPFLEAFRAHLEAARQRVAVNP